MVRLVATEEILEIVLGLILKSVAIRGPSTTRELKSMNSISFSSDDSLSMEEGSIFVFKFDPLFSRFLVPKYFFLEKDVVVFLL